MGLKRPLGRANSGRPLFPFKPQGRAMRPEGSKAISYRKGAEEFEFTGNREKWQKKWAETGLYHFDKHSSKPKNMCWRCSPYPSGAKLHAGHWYNYSLADTYARFFA